MKPKYFDRSIKIISSAGFDQKIFNFFLSLVRGGGLNEILYTPVDIGLRVTNEFGIYHEPFWNLNVRFVFLS
jgi:hypothetical protein